MILSGLNDHAPEACAMIGGVHGELAQVASRTPNLNIDAAKKAAGTVPCFRDQNSALLHHDRESSVVSARTLKKSLDGVGGVDQRNQAGSVGRGCQANTKRRIGAGSVSCFLVHRLD